MCGDCCRAGVDALCGDERERLGRTRELRGAIRGLLERRRSQVANVVDLQEKLDRMEELQSKVVARSRTVQEKRVALSSLKLRIERRWAAVAARAKDLEDRRRALEEGHGRLVDALRRNQRDVEMTLTKRKWKKVCQLFAMLPIEVAYEAADDPGLPRGGGGGAGQLGKICGLPLPSGPGARFLPDFLVVSALRHVCRLCIGVAAALDISLPHRMDVGPATGVARIHEGSAGAGLGTPYEQLSLKHIT